MSDRDEVDRFPLGVLESGERYVGCLHFRQGVSFTEAARLWHEVATFASHHLGRELEVEDAEVCREYDSGASVCIYEHPVVSAIDAERHATMEGQT